MQHYCPPKDVELVDLDIEFGNPVERMPPQRQLHNVQYEGMGFSGRTFSFRLARIGMDVVRENFKKYPRDLPPFQGRMDYLQYWVVSMWEAMFNPMWFRWVRPEDFIHHPQERKRGRIPNLDYQLLHGHHRIRLLDALDASHLWVYMCTGHHHGPDLPAEYKRLRALADRPPLRGTRTAMCEECGQPSPVSSRKFNEFNIKRWYTCKCGHIGEGYQPYPERL